MTRREFQIIAAALKRSHAPLHVVESLADVLRTRNPNFDHGRFLHESGIRTPQQHFRRPCANTVRTLRQEGFRG